MKTFKKCLSKTVASVYTAHTYASAYVNLWERFIKRGVCEAYPNTAQAEVSAYVDTPSRCVTRDVIKERNPL